MLRCTSLMLLVALAAGVCTESPESLAGKLHLKLTIQQEWSLGEGRPFRGTSAWPQDRCYFATYLLASLRLPSTQSLQSPWERSLFYRQLAHYKYLLVSHMCWLTASVVELPSNWPKIPQTTLGLTDIYGQESHQIPGKDMDWMKHS